VRLGGAIVGRALYDGRLNPREALAMLRGAGPPRLAGAAQ
jgi:phosphoribosylformimino-5-aminoimidazole carboxamide ribonucleotide (ProFAR) isomerase